MRAWLQKLPALFLLIALAGCATRPQQPGSKTAVRPTTRAAATAAQNELPSAMNPCAERLHDLCGLFLYHFAQFHAMPLRLEDLQDPEGPEPVTPIYCPESRKPYTYLPAGIAISNPAGRIVVYDSTPGHDGVRWTIVVSPGDKTDAPIARVVGIPEGRFAVLRQPVQEGVDKPEINSVLPPGR